MLETRSRAGRPLGIALGLSPVLCEQLAHPDFHKRVRLLSRREDRGGARGPGLVRAQRRARDGGARRALGSVLPRSARGLHGTPRAEPRGAVPPARRAGRDRDPHVRRDARLPAAALERRRGGRPGAGRVRDASAPLRPRAARDLAAGVRLSTRRALAVARDGGARSPDAPARRHRGDPRRARLALLLRRHSPAHGRPRARRVRRPLRSPPPPGEREAERRIRRARRVPALPRGRGGSRELLRPRPRHRDPGVERRAGIPRRRRVSRLPQETLPRRAPVLARDAPEGGPRAQGDVSPGARGGARARACRALPPPARPSDRAPR